MLRLGRENEFKVRAYANAAKAIAGFRGDLASALADGTLRNVPGIGAAIFEKISTLVNEGRLPYLEELRARFPASLAALYRVPGLGPKKVDVLREKLGVHSLEDLEAACRDGRVAALPGFGRATQAKILAGIAVAAEARQARPFAEAAALAVRLRDLLADSGLADSVAIGGEIRRGTETVGDVVLVAAAKDADPLLDFFLSLPGSEENPSRDGSRASARFAGGIPVELRVAPPSAWGAAVVEATGSDGHVARLRERAAAMGVPFSKHRSEESLYRALDLPAIAPELREDRGELEAADGGSLPRLIEEEDIRGLFHVHTTESDGADTLEAMVEAASRLGLSYVAITDHSKIAGYAHGLDERRVEIQHAAIDALQKRYPKLRIFKGTEADILPDGAIDFGDRFLERFDIVVASVHSRFDLPEKEQTRRLVRAAENPRVAVLGHLTGRLVLRRSGIALDIPRVLDAAAASGCAVEINGSPRRLELDWRWHREAIRRRVLLSIGPDAHATRELDYFRFGVRIARKGWVEAENVLNTRPASAIAAWVHSRR